MTRTNSISTETLATIGRQVWWNSPRCDESRRAERRERIDAALFKSVPLATKELKWQVPWHKQKERILLESLRERNGRSATISTICDE